MLLYILLGMFNGKYYIIWGDIVDILPYNFKIKFDNVFILFLN